MVRRKTVVQSVVVVTIGLASLLVVSDATHTIIAGDPATYRERVLAILAGGIPYVEVPVEHLPGALIPMFLAWWLGGSASQSAFVFAFALLMIGTMAYSLVLIDRLGLRVGASAAGRRWLVVAMPLVPLVIFRNDPVVTLLFAAAALALISGRQRWAAVGVIGALTKIWPSVLALTGFRRGRHVGSVVTGIAGAVAVGWTLVPGFTDARSGIGIHAETTMGALVGLTRLLDGGQSGVQITTAAYLPVEGWIIAANAALGLGLVIVGLSAMNRGVDDLSNFLALGSIVVGIILTSHLLSLQYLLWVTPFIALSPRRRTLVGGLLCSVLTIAIAWIWQPVRFEAAGFYLALTTRNLFLLMIGWWLASEARDAARSSLAKSQNGGLAVT